MACKHVYKGVEYSLQEARVLHGVLSQPYGALEIEIGLRFPNGRRKRKSIRAKKGTQEWKSEMEARFPNIQLEIIKVPGYGPQAGKLFYGLKVVSAGKKDSFTTDYLPLSAKEASAESVKKAESKDDYATLVRSLKRQYNETDRQLTTIKSKIANETAVSKLKSLNGLEGRLEVKLEGLSAEIDKAGKVTKLEDLRDFAISHIERAKSLVSEDMSDADITEAKRYIELWSRAGDFSTKDNIFFSKKELGSDKLKYGYKNKAGEDIPGFADFKNEMDNISRDLETIIEGNLVNWVNDTLESDYSLEEVTKAVVDLGNLSTAVLDASRQSDPLMNAVYKTTKRASLNAKLEADEVFGEVDKLIEKAMPGLKALSGNKDPFDILLQKDKFGNDTGNLVYRFSQDFYDKSFELLNIAKKLNRGDKGYEAAWNNLLHWKKNNTITFDPRLLFPTSEGDTYHYAHNFSEGLRESHLADLKSQLGSKGFEYYIKQAEKDVEKFKLQYESVKDEMSAHQLDKWDKENSPYYAARMIGEGKGVKTTEGIFVNPKETYVQTVPRKTTSDGESTAWYDKNFEAIESNPDVLEFYQRYMEIQRELLSFIPEHKRKGVYNNSLLSIRKDIIENMNGSPVKGASAHFFEKIIEGTRMSDISENAYSDTDEFGNIEKSVNVNIVNNRKLVNEMSKVRIIQFKADNNRNPTRDEVLRIRSEASSELSANKSHDLGKIMKALAVQSLAYKHKSKHEDTFRLAAHLMAEREQIETNAAGKILLDNDGNPLVSSKKLVNYEKVLENHIDNFYGISTKKIEGRTEQKTYTAKEKARKKEIENAIEANKVNFNSKLIGASDFEKNEALLDKQLENLGGVITGNKIVDSLLKYVQLKSMGWNIPSAFANIAFGDIANLLQGSDGRNFTLKQFFAARKLTLGSTLKASGINNKTGNKISAWMDKLDILKDASEELYKRSDQSIFSKKTSFLTPYELQKRSEFLVSSPVMIAMMMNRKVSKEGEESTLWDVLDESGDIPEGYTIEGKKLDWDSMIDFKIEVDQVVKKTHGNYDSESPITIKNSSIGRLMSQFRTWMFEGVASRWESEKFDDVLNMQTKGRWRSYASAMSNVSDILFTVKQLARKASFQSTKFDERFSEVDAANMRANLTEIIIFMNLYAMGALLSAFAGDDEDDNSYVLNFLMNQMGRLQSDILLYINPMEVQKMQKNIIPATVILDDVSGWFEAVGYLIEGNDGLNSGPNKDDSRLLRKTFSLIPGAASLQKAKSQFETNYTRI